MSLVLEIELFLRYSPVWFYLERSIVFLYILLLSLLAASNFVDAKCSTPKRLIPLLAFKAIGTWGFNVLSSIVFGEFHSVALKTIFAIHCLWLLSLFKPQSRRFVRLASVLVAIVFSLSLIVVLSGQEPLTRSINVSKVPERLCGNSRPSKQPFNVTFAEYVKKHNYIVKNVAEDDWKVVHFIPNEDGLGNRLEGMVSAFVMALVTDRLFVIDWNRSPKCNAGLYDLFQAPGFPWDTFPSYVNGTWTSYDYCRTCLFRRPSSSWGNLMCEPDFGIPDLEKFQYLSLTSTQWFAAVLARNPYYRDRVCELIGEDIFGTVARELLRPSPVVRKMIDSVKLDEFQENIFLRCAAQISETEDSKFFLATDDDHARVRMREVAGNRIIELPKAKFSRDTTEGVQMALAEMFLHMEELPRFLGLLEGMGSVAAFSPLNHASTIGLDYLIDTAGKMTSILPK